MTKIALINAPYSFRINDFFSKGFVGIKNLSWSPMPRLWSLALASYLYQAISNVDVEIIDGTFMDMNGIFEKIKRKKYDVVGLSPTVVNYKENLEIARFAKKHGVRVVLGGHYATALRREIMCNRGPYSNDYCVDVVIQHDGERAFFEYVSGKPFSKINNLVFQTKNRQVVEGPIEFLDLDKLPQINYGLINLEEYFKKQPLVTRRTIPFVSQRGCAWAEKAGRCLFCSVQEKKLRTRSPQQIWQEIKGLVKKYGVKIIFDACDDFIGSRDWFNEFYKSSPVFKSRPIFKVDIRSVNVNPSDIPIFKKLNIKYITFGTESFSNKILFGFHNEKIIANKF